MRYDIHSMTILALAASMMTPIVAGELRDDPPAAMRADQEQALIRRMRDEQLTKRLLPRPMTSPRLEWIAATLELDEKSLETWSNMVEQYEREWERLGADGVRGARRLKASAYDWNVRRERFIPRPVSDLFLLEETSSKIRGVIQKIDDDLFENLALLVSEEHLHTARGIIHRRIIERNLRPSTIPGSQIDITRLVDDLEIDEEYKGAIAAWAESYRPEFRDEIRMHARLVDRDLKAQAEELIELGPLPEHDVRQEEMDFVAVDRSERRAEILETEIALLNVNRKHVGRARSMLPPRASLQLLRAWQESLGGGYLKEQGRLVELIESSIMEPGLDDRSREAMLLIPDEVMSRNEKLDALILEQEILSGILVEEPRSADRDARVLSMSAVVLESNVKRRKTLITGIQTLLGILSNDAPEMTRRLVAFESELQARNGSDVELAERSKARSISIDNRMVWEAVQDRIRRALETPPNAEGSNPANDEMETEDP
jgi:hypothetical protein